MIKVHAVSLGCPKNRVDTEYMLGALAGMSGGANGIVSLEGMVSVDDPIEADVVLVNTCGFIRPAVEESVRTILDMVADIADDIPDNGYRTSGLLSGMSSGGEKKSRRPVLAVAGCLVSRYGAEELAGELPEVDVWLSTDELDQWPERISAALGQDVPAIRRLRSTPPSFAYLKVAEGCGHKCAFCTIPSIRGPLRSVPLAALEDEARMLVDGGVRELVLVAQDLTSYGQDMADGGGDFVRLVERLMNIENLDWLRLMYLYPAGLTDRAMDFLAANCATPAGGADAGVAGSPLLPYFDVPLQHAHPDVLARMGRPFARDPRRVLDRIRAAVPHAALRTSLITGFPGETDEHYEALRNFVQQALFTHLGVFAFEREEGTAAWSMDNQVDEEVARERRDGIMEVQARISEDFLAEFEGRALDVLVDEEHDEWPGLHVGRAWFQAPEVDGAVYVSGDNVQPGRMVACAIEEAKTYDLVALAE